MQARRSTVVGHKTNMSAAQPARAIYSTFVLAVGPPVFLAFALLLYIRPYLQATVAPYKSLDNHPFYNATRFGLTAEYTGGDFFDHWNWETMDDPTHGRVNYVDQATAIRTNLSFAANNKFVMRADDWSVVPPNARGRNSVRISSKETYGDSAIVLDLQHMPEGCSTWPAFWSLSEKGPWPSGGEIDIVEGVNMNTQNLGSLHTMPQCEMAQQRLQTGATVSTNCDASVNYNQGCGTTFPGASYGTPFNNANGGYFVMVRTQHDGVRMWFWTRSDPNTPEAVRSATPTLLGQPTLTPESNWGSPAASFPMGATCEYESHFDPHRLVFDITLCGDWAGNDYASSGCAGSCVDHVNNNPEAFRKAFWEVNSLRVYTPISS